MAPLLQKKQEELLHELYYKKGLSVGRDKLYAYLCDNYPDDGISRRQVNNWLQSQEVHQLHQEHTKATATKSSIYVEPYYAIAIDLVDMSHFETPQGYKYLFNGVDMFSRFLYSVPLKNKEDKSVLDGFKKIIKIHKFKSMRSDNGSEFINNLMKDYCKKQNIKQVFSSPHLPQSNGAIERQNGTLKRLIFKQIQINNDYDWATNLQTLINNLNNTIVRQFQKTPQQIQDAFTDIHNEKNIDFITNIHEKDIEVKKNTTTKQKFKYLDKVRIFTPATDRMKSLQWSTQVYQIDKVYKPKQDYSAFTYKLKGSNKRYMDNDLQKIEDVQNNIDGPELFEVSQIIKPVIHDNERYFNIAWKGYRGQNTIEPRRELMKTIPKMINLFEKRNNIKWIVNKKTKVLSYQWDDSNKK